MSRPFELDVDVLAATLRAQAERTTAAQRVAEARATIPLGNGVALRDLNTVTQQYWTVTTNGPTAGVSVRQYDPEDFTPASILYTHYFTNLMDMKTKEAWRSTHHAPWQQRDSWLFWTKGPGASDAYRMHEAGQYFPGVKGSSRGRFQILLFEFPDGNLLLGPDNGGDGKMEWLK